MHLLFVIVCCIDVLNVLFSCSHGGHCPLKVNLTLLKPAPRPKMYWIWWVSYTDIKLDVPYIQHSLMWGSLFAQPHCGFFQPSAAWTHLGGATVGATMMETCWILRCWKSELTGKLTKHWKIIPKNLSRNPIVYSLSLDVCWRLLYFNSLRNHSNPKFWWFFGLNHPWP